MQGTFQGVIFMGHDIWGESVTRKDGSLVRYLACYDQESKEIVKLTIAPDFDGDLPEEMTEVEVDFRGVVRNEAGISDGRAFAKGASVKMQALAIRAV